MRTLTRLCLLSLLSTVAACEITDVEIETPFGEGVGEYAEELDAAGLVSVVAEEDRSEFDLLLLDDGFTASDLAVRNEEMSEDERIQSRIAALDDSADGRLTLALGGLQVSFDADTRFWIGDDPATREAFLEEVRRELAAGNEAPVVAERDARMDPQHPDDDDFVARDVALAGDGEPSLRMKIRSGNLETVVNPSSDQPDMYLRALGHRIRLRTRDRTTQAHFHRRQKWFAGQVTEVDVDGRTFRLEDGLTVRVDRRTSFARWDGHARSLRAAAEALEEGHEVHARGIGILERRSDRLFARRVALKIEVVEPEPEPEVMEFEGVIANVLRTVATETTNTTLVLADGSSIQVDGDTEIVAADDVSPGSLAQLFEALEAGREVMARGHGHVMGKDPLVLKGLRVVLQSEAPEDQLAEFAGRVDYVSDGGAVILLDGVAVVVTAETEIVAANEDSPGSIEGLRAALDMGRRVNASGVGRAEGESEIFATRLVLTTQVEDFDLFVASVDAGGLVMSNGSFVALSESTVVTAVGNGPTDLNGVFGALFTGDRVRARGIGFVIGGNPEAGEPLSFEAIAIEFERLPGG